MRKSFFTFTLISLSLISFSLVSCSKVNDDLESLVIGESSFTMTVDGTTYTDIDNESLILLGSIITAVSEDEFSLYIAGVGADGTTTNIDDDEDNGAALILTFDESVGANVLVAESGTIKRNGKKIEVNVNILQLSGEAKPLTATIVVGQVILN